MSTVLLAALMCPQREGHASPVSPGHGCSETLPVSAFPSYFHPPLSTPPFPGPHHSQDSKATRQLILG